MMLAAASPAFATTPAGYISGILVPIMGVACAALVGYFWKQVRGKFDSLEQNDRDQAAAMTSTTQALAILVERIAPMQNAIALNTGHIQTLNESVAVLRQKLTDHEAWAAKEHDRQIADARDSRRRA